MKPLHTATTAARRGWLPHPILSALLAASWLALSHSLAVVHLLSVTHNHRVRVRVFCPEDDFPVLPSVTPTV